MLTYNSLCNVKQAYVQKACSLVLLAVLAGCFFSCSTLKSDLTIQPGKQFALGGNQNGAFTVNLRNVGEVPVTVISKKEGGDTVSFGRFAPGEQRTIRFTRRSAVLIDNASATPARLFLVVTGDKALSMREQ